MNMKKNDFSKKDMNFFSEFSSSGAKNAKILTASLGVLLIVAVIGLGVFSILKIQTARVQSKINDIQSELKDSDNLQAIQDFEQLSIEVARLREYVYVLTDLDTRLESMPFASSSVMDTLTEEIPAEIALTTVTFKEGAVTFGGTSDTYDAPLNYAQLLQEKNLFTYVHVETIPYNHPDSELTPEEIQLLNKYTFILVGTLESSYSVRFTRYLDTEPKILLGVPVTKDYLAGESYGETDIATFTQDGETYTLSRILIDGTLVPPEQFQAMLDADAVTGNTLATTSIELYYKVSDDTKE